MTNDERTFLGQFFRAVTDRPLEPTDSSYVALYEVPSLDPVELLARAIEWTPGGSVQLLSGFRGTGKSTELRRLRKGLVDAGYVVVLCDVQDYLNLSTPVDVSDFLLALAGAFGEGLAATGLLPGDPSVEGYWTRAANFLKRTKVELSDVSGNVELDAIAASLKLNLKGDPSFRRRLQERMAGHLGALVEHVKHFIHECVAKVQEQLGRPADVVLLVDSVEHIRGTSANAPEVQSSVEILFAGHADKLHLEPLHVVYTVPPYVKVLYPGLGALYAPGGVQVLPALKLWDRSTREQHEPGVSLMEKVVLARGDWKRLLGDPSNLKLLVQMSGGHLRDLLRLLAEVIRRADSLPVTQQLVVTAVDQVKTEFLPIADADAVWLARIMRTHEASLEESARLPDLARFLDTHLVLCYRNGEEWYDVHPLIQDVVTRHQGEATD